MAPLCFKLMQCRSLEKRVRHNGIQPIHRLLSSADHISLGKPSQTLCAGYHVDSDKASLFSSSEQIKLTLSKMCRVSPIQNHVHLNSRSLTLPIQLLTAQLASSQMLRTMLVGPLEQALSLQRM